MVLGAMPLFGIAMVLGVVFELDWYGVGCREFVWCGIGCRELIGMVFGVVRQCLCLELIGMVLGVVRMVLGVVCMVLGVMCLFEIGMVLGVVRLFRVDPDPLGLGFG